VLALLVLLDILSGLICIASSLLAVARTPVIHQPKSETTRRTSAPPVSMQRVLVSCSVVMEVLVGQPCSLSGTSWRPTQPQGLGLGGVLIPCSY
jgi:hypothetical protein